MKWHLYGSISMAYGDVAYQYNNHGTLTAKTQGGITTEYVYDARGSLMQVSEGTNTIRYTLDPFGRWIGREKDGETTHRWLYQNFLQPIEEIKDGVRTRFVYATGVNVPDYMIRENETYRFIRDIRGSVRLVVDAVGNVAQRIDYDEWGNVLLDTNAGFQPIGFAGRLYDPDTALIRFGYRDYDPGTGRWTAKDPIFFDGGQVNLYLYCHGDPINFLDPMGLTEEGRADRILRDIRQFYDAIGIASQEYWWVFRNATEYIALFSLSGGEWGPLDFKVRGGGPFLLNGKIVADDYFGNYVAGYQAGYGNAPGLLLGVILGGQFWANISDEEPGDLDSHPAIEHGFLDGRSDRNKKRR